MSDWNTPVIESLYADFLDFLKVRDVDTATLFKDAASNIPIGTIRYDRIGNKFQEWNGTDWIDKVLSVAGGGTSSATPGGSGLGLGTMAQQNANAVAITGGTVVGLNNLVVNGAGQIVGILTTGSLGIQLTDATGKIRAINSNYFADPNITAAQVSSGILAQARLGNGATGSGTRVLLDNQTWALLDTVAGGGVKEIVHQNAAMGTDEMSRTFNIPWTTGAPSSAAYVEVYLKGPALNVAGNGGTNYLSLRVLNATQFAIDQRASGGATGAVAAAFDYTAIQYKP